jgi:hypothetical protein
VEKVKLRMEIQNNEHQKELIGLRNKMSDELNKYFKEKYKEKIAEKDARIRELENKLRER